MKGVRKQQAEQQTSNVEGGTAVSATRRGRKATLPARGAAPMTLVGRADTQRCEALAWHLARGCRAEIAADSTKEQIFFVYSGTGTIKVGNEKAALEAKHTLFVPRGTSCMLEAGTTGLLFVSLGTVVQR